MATPMAGIYGRLFESLPRFLRRRIHPLEFGIRDFVLEAVPRQPDRTVLDAGAGEARFASFFSQHRYIAVDSGVGDARWDYSGVDVLGDLGALPIQSGAVDVVLNTQVLEHVRSPEAVIREFFRVLRPGGEMFLTAPQGWCEHQQPHDFYRFTRFSLSHLFQTGGFQSWTIEPMGGYFHYLGHRLTYIPKILFSGRTGAARWLLSPLELLTLFLFCFLAPICCYYLDRLDRDKEFTLGYRCRARKA